MHSLLFRFILLAGVLHGCLSAFSQSTRWILDSYSKNEGLPATEVFDVIQTEDGFLWLGTDRGLLRFDGHSFKSYTSHPDNTNSISNNYLVELETDNHGQLWISADGKINIYDPASTSFRRIDLLNDNNKHDEVMSLSYNSLGDTMWVCTRTRILYSTGRNGELKPIDFKLSNRDIGGFLTYEKNGLLYLSCNQGIFEIYQNGKIKREFHIPLNNNTSENNMCHFLSEDGTIWAGNWSDGLYKIIQNEAPVNFLYIPDVQNAIYSIVRSQSNPDELLIGTIDGLRIFNTKIEKFVQSDLLSSEDPNPVVYSIYKSGDATWFATNDGLKVVDQKKYVFKKHILENVENEVYPLRNLEFESKSGIVWFIQRYKRIHRYDLKTDKEIPIPAKLLPFLTDKGEINAIAIDGEDNLWLNSMTKGILVYSLTHDSITLEAKRNKENPVFTNIIPGPGGTCWLSSVAGLYSISLHDKEIRPVSEVNQYIREQNLSAHLGSVILDRHKNLWMVSGWSDDIKESILYYNTSTNKTLKIDPVSDDQLKLIGHIEGLMVSREDVLYVYGDNGIGYSKQAGIPDKQNLEFKFIKSREGCFDAIEDAENRIWISCKSEIGYITPDTDDITYYNHHNSNLSKTNLSELATFNNSIYFTHISDITEYDLDKFKFPVCHPPFLSEAFIQNYDFTTMPKSGDRLKLRHDQNTVLLHFTNFNFTNAIQNQYEFRLHQGAAWNKMDQNKLDLNALGYGDYTLEVRTANSFGIWSDEIFTLNIHIKPPFTRSAWFFGILTILLGLFFYLLYKFRLNQIKKLEVLRTTISRDLHDDMGADLAQIKIISEIEAVKNSHPAFQVINDKLTQVMGNISDMVWSINPKKDSLSELVLHIQEYAIEMLEPKGINLQFKIDDTSTDIRISPEVRRNFYLIFKEGIHNIVKYANATEVRYSFENNNGKIISSLVDNGVGMKTEHAQKGNGLINMRQRAEQIGGELTINSQPGRTEVRLEVGV